MCAKKIEGVIAAGHHQTARAGKLAFEAGGNAMDAAVAALFAACVAEPCMSSFGGGGFATIRTPQNGAKVLDFFCQTPLQKLELSELDFEPVHLQFNETTEVFQVGMGAVAVPGMVHGIFALHERYGTLPIKLLAEPAIELARNGSEVDWFQAYDFELLEVIFKRGEDSKEIFYDGGTRLGEGGTIKNIRFADLLVELIAEGPSFFYEGQVAKSIADDFVSGGLVSELDLSEYESIWRAPLEFDCQGFKVLTNPHPSRGGNVIAQTLTALERSSHPRCDFGSAAYANWIVAGLFAGAEKADETYTKSGSTTHISTADSDGNAVSVSVSNGEGSGYFIPETGIQMNNMLGESALLPDGYNSWLPGTRVQSLMAPTVLENSNDSIIALGTGGAGRIPTSISQVVSHLLFEQVSIREAIERGRMYIHDHSLELEPGLVSPAQLMAPLRQSNQWSELDMFFGGVHVASISDGELSAVGDLRRNGAVAGSNLEQG